MALNFVLIFIVKILLWLPLSLLQIFESFKQKKRHEIPLHERYGLYGFLGLAGRGKTISMVYSLLLVRKKYKNRVYIVTNFPCKLADYVLPHIQDKNGETKTDYRPLLKFYDKPVFVAWDEMQNDFPQTNFKDFPQDLLRRLTQLRKGCGMVIYYTTQDIKHIDVNIRRLTFSFNECKTYKNRFTYYINYDPVYYIAKYESVSIDNKMKVPINFVKFFYQTNTIRSLYNSFTFV